MNEILVTFTFYCAVKIAEHGPKVPCLVVVVNGVCINIYAIAISIIVSVIVGSKSVAYDVQ